MSIQFHEDDAVVLKKSERESTSILTVIENGYGKRTGISEYRLQSRGGKGVSTIKTSERNGLVVGALQVEDSDQVVMLIADSAKVIRLPMDSFRVIGRNTQGVRMINLGEGEKVVDMSILARSSEEDSGEE